MATVTSTADSISDRLTNLTFTLTLNLSSFDIARENIPHSSHVFRLAQNSVPYWITMTLLFLFISFDFILSYVSTNHPNGESRELIDFTDEDTYRLLSPREFRCRYGPRASIHHEKPYHFYRRTVEASKR